MVTVADQYIDMSLNQITCVTFDLDDTLWPITETILNAENALYKWFGQYYPEICSRYSRRQLLERRIQLQQSVPELEHDVTRLREYSLSVLAMEFGYPEKMISAAMDEFLLHRNRVTLFDDAHETLTYLSKRYSLGVITNGNASVERIGLSGFFSFVVTAGEAGAMKPDGIIFKQAIRRAGVRKEQILHIGDDPHSDILGAMSAGLRSVWLNRKRKAWPGGQNPTHVVHTLAELVDIL